MSEGPSIGPANQIVVDEDVRAFAHLCFMARVSLGTSCTSAILASAFVRVRRSLHLVFWRVASLVRHKVSFSRSAEGVELGKICLEGRKGVGKEAP